MVFVILVWTLFLQNYLLWDVLVFYLTKRHSPHGHIMILNETIKTHIACSILKCKHWTYYKKNVIIKIKTYLPHYYISLTQIPDISSLEIVDQPEMKLGKGNAQILLKVWVYF